MNCSPAGTAPRLVRCPYKLQSHTSALSGRDRVLNGKNRPVIKWEEAAQEAKLSVLPIEGGKESLRILLDQCSRPRADR